MLILRPESRSQHSAVRHIHELAFGRPDEARLVDKLREQADFLPHLSLVAQQDKEPVGHLLLSPIQIEDGETSHPALALAPLAVLPDYQNQGIGSQLMRYALDRCQEYGHTVVILLGSPRYYSRFGFEMAVPHGILPPDPQWESAFQVWCADSRQLEAIKGTVVYPPPFLEV